MMPSDRFSVVGVFLLAMDPDHRTVPTTRLSSTYWARSRHHNVTLMRSLGASRSEVAIDVGPEEMQRSIRAAGIDVEVLEVIAHDVVYFGVRKCAPLRHLSVFNFGQSRTKQIEHTVGVQWGGLIGM